jgi:hypothetical protein
MISDYLLTVESDFLNFIKELPQSSIGRNIKIFQNESVDFEEADIAFIALDEYRGS